MPLLIMLILLFPRLAFADFAQAPAKGFHWYSTEAIKKEPLPAPKRAAPPPLSPYDQILAMRKATRNKLAKALLTPSFEATHEYMKAQQVYAKNNQKFVRFWQEVLLVHPELDYTLNFPADNAAIAVANDETNALTNKMVTEASKKYGLILFYRGNSSLSQKFITHLMPFVNEHHFAMISVTTDNQPITGLPNPKNIPLELVQKKLAIQSRYMPALFLVNLKNNTISPLSYGFISLTDLKARFLDVATRFKRFSYEGVKP
jgi:conjugal transfer pilus assembly protein TraF